MIKAVLNSIKCYASLGKPLIHFKQQILNNKQSKKHSILITAATTFT